MKSFKENLEKYINDVQKYWSKKTLAFLHSWHSSIDVINALPVIKELSKTHKCTLYLQVEKPYTNNHPNNYCPYLLPEHLFKMLIPLLRSQDYLLGVKNYLKILSRDRY